MGRKPASPTRDTAAALSAAFITGIGQRYSHLFEDERQPYTPVPAAQHLRDPELRRFLFVYAAIVGSAVALLLVAAFWNG